jgi:hypothetical protein
MWSPISKVSFMDPDGILNAWTTNVRMKRARITATTIASMFSRNAPFFFGGASATSEFFKM